MAARQKRASRGRSGLDTGGADQPQRNRHDVDSYAERIKLTAEAIRGFLRARGQCREEKSGGSSHSAFRVQKKFGSNRKVTVGFVRLVQLYALLRREPGFDYAALGQHFRLAEQQRQPFAEWVGEWLEDNEIGPFVDRLVEEAGSSEEEPSEDDEGDDPAYEDAAEAEAEGSERKSTASKASMVPSRFLKAVADSDLETFILALGMHPPSMEDGQSGQDRRPELLQLMENLSIEHGRKTFRDYAGYANFYLLWLLSRDDARQRWEDGEDLLVEARDLQRFLQEYWSTMIRTDGTQPWVVDVLRGECEAYSIAAADDATAVGSSTIHKIVSAVAKLEGLQHAIAGETAGTSVAKSVLVRAFVKMADTTAPTRNKEKVLDRQRNVNVASFDLQTKAMESEMYLSLGGAHDIRDRATMLSCVFSISRYSECVRWDLADCFRVAYPSSAADAHNQQVETMYIIQSMSKTRCDERFEDWNVLSRHKDVRQCPIGALAFWMFWRFHVLLEPFPTIDAEKRTWYSIKLFPKESDPRCVVNSQTAARRKKVVRKELDVTRRAVLHDDRHYGAFYGRLMKVDDDDLSQLGFWQTDVRTRSYTKILKPTTVCRMAGFEDEADYFHPRAALSPDECTDEDIRKLVESIFPPLGDEEFVKRVEKKCQGRPLESDYAAVNVLEVFKMLRRIFLQDLHYYKESFPGLELWDCALLKQNCKGLYKWLELHSDVMGNVSRLKNVKGRPPRVLSCGAKKVGSIVSMRDACPPGYVREAIEGTEHLGILTKDPANQGETGSCATADVDGDGTARMLHRQDAMQESLQSVWGVLAQQSSDMSQIKKATGELVGTLKVLPSRVVQEQPTADAADENPFTVLHADPITEGIPARPPESRYLFTKLPPLGRYSLKALWREWCVETVIGHEKFRPLGHLEKERCSQAHGEQPYRPTKLRTEIFKRQTIVSYLMKKAAEEFGGHSEGSIDRAIEEVGNEMAAKKGPKWTMRSLFYDLTQYSQGKKKAAPQQTDSQRVEDE